MTVNNALTQAVLDSFQQHKQQLLGKRVWLACSGGRDSLTLAYLCRQLFISKQLPFLPQLLHVNHGMQQANDSWAEQVSIWAEQKQMPCQTLSISLAQKTEQAARRARYEAMMSVMNHDDVLMLGHHQDDQVETLLMRLFNGAGVNGLGGMNAWTTKQISANDSQRFNEDNFCSKKVFLWRPLLIISREQITQYADNHQLPYIDDPTNVAKQDIGNGQLQQIPRDDINDRAWLRTVLLPRITERYPKAKQAIARSSQLMQEASIIISERSSTDLAQVLISDHLWCSILDIDQLTTLSIARQSTLIHSWLAPSKAELPPSKRLVDEVLALVQRKDSDHQTCLNWDNGIYQYQIRRYQNKLYRLTDDFSQWLQLPPKPQSIKVDNPYSCNRSSIALKHSDTSFEWQLIGLPELLKVITAHFSDDTGYKDLQPKQPNQPKHFAQANLDKLIQNDTDFQLNFQPLPRDSKLTLSGRVGRKSGKKLLQAIDQPSFMRQSVVLGSLYLPSQSQALPLFIIALDKIVILQSDFAKFIEDLIINKALTTFITPAVSMQDKLS